MEEEGKARSSMCTWLCSQATQEEGKYFPSPTWPEKKATYTSYPPLSMVKSRPKACRRLTTSLASMLSQAMDMTNADTPSTICKDQWGGLLTFSRKKRATEITTPMCNVCVSGGKWRKNGRE